MGTLTSYPGRGVELLDGAWPDEGVHYLKPIQAFAATTLRTFLPFFLNSLRTPAVVA